MSSDEDIFEKLMKMIHHHEQNYNIKPQCLYLSRYEYDLMKKQRESFMMSMNLSIIKDKPEKFMGIDLHVIQTSAPPPF